MVFLVPPPRDRQRQCKYGRDQNIRLSQGLDAIPSVRDICLSYCQARP